MVPLLLIVALPLVLSHWLLQPLTGIATPMLDLAWLGWSLALLSLWLLAGGQ